MELTFLSIFTTWLSIFNVGFSFMGLVFVREWRKRKSAEGFSSVNFVLAMFIGSCWLQHGLMTGEYSTVRIHAMNIVILSGYCITYAYYQPNKKPLVFQISVALTAVALIYLYVHSQEASLRNHIMGSIAAGAQVLRNAGAIYEISRVVRLGHTEYVPAVFQFSLFTMMSQWLLFGFLTDNRANLIGLVFNLATISLYFKYPPLTWRVPIIGTGPQQKKSE